jgi:hypothetical protein
MPGQHSKRDLPSLPHLWRTSGRTSPERVETESRSSAHVSHVQESAISI